MMQNEFIKQAVFQACKRDPSLVEGVIHAATVGVKAFAKDQNDHASQMAAYISDLLSNFSRAELDKLTFFKGIDLARAVVPWYKGTEFYRKVLLRDYPELAEQPKPEPAKPEGPQCPICSSHFGSAPLVDGKCQRCNYTKEYDFCPSCESSFSFAPPIDGMCQRCNFVLPLC